MTLQEVIQQLSDHKRRRLVLEHLVEHIDATFLPVGEGKPKSVLLDENKLPVPPSVFESVVQELVEEMQTADAAIRALESVTVVQSSPLQGASS